MKPKFLFKIDHNLHGKVYINNKWQKDVTKVEVIGLPNDYSIRIVQHKRKNGKIVIENNEIATQVHEYHFGRNYDN